MTKNVSKHACSAPALTPLADYPATLQFQQNHFVGIRILSRMRIYYRLRSILLKQNLRQFSIEKRLT